MKTHGHSPPRSAPAAKTLRSKISDPILLPTEPLIVYNLSIQSLTGVTMHRRIIIELRKKFSKCRESFHLRRTVRILKHSSSNITLSLSSNSTELVPKDGILSIFPPLAMVKQSSQFSIPTITQISFKHLAPSTAVKIMEIKARKGLKLISNLIETIF